MTDADINLHKGLMKILGEGTFPLQAKEVSAFIKIYEWANSLPVRLEAIKKPIKKKAKKT